jgi:phosphohistidine phosphatase
MQIWLVRHAIAAEREEFDGPDEERPLTAKGKKQFGAFADWLAGQVEAPMAVVTSPLVRAVETAEILRKALGLKKKDLAESAALSCGAAPERLLEAARHSSAERVALVGHEPDLSAALGEFISGGRVAFRKGFVAAVEFSEEPVLGSGRLCWFVGPRL